MLNINEVQSDCTGCSACFALCPVNAISMKENSEGFLYPEIDEAKCTNCGLCAKNCPVLNSVYLNSYEPECYAVMASDDIRKGSSSGGVFPVLAYTFLENGGFVCGAVWDGKRVIHIVSDKKEDIERMRSSKYLQSSMENCYCEIKQLLQSDKEVLFTGTPCQIAGLNAFLKKDYEKLTTVEIVCHGVPSPKAFRKYLDETLNVDEEFISTNFRDKVNGWSKYFVTTTTSKRILSESARKNIYIKTFLDNLCLRSSCENCKFNKIPRQADLTIGDFWGIGKFSKKLNDKKGTSLVLVNNDKGKKNLGSIRQELKTIAKVPLEYAVKGNPVLVGSSLVNPKRKVFMKNLETKSLTDSLKSCFDNSCDFLIVNFWDSYNNYGAVLTAYAMQELIRGFGFTAKCLKDAERINKRMIKASVQHKFANQFLDFTSQLSFNEAVELTKSIKGVIVGSDQVFRLSYISRSPNKYLLGFVDKSCRKLAISASFGVDKSEFVKNTSYKKMSQKANKILQSFDYLSCREISGKEIYKDVYNLDSDAIIDPVFLIPKDKYNKIAECSKIDYTDKVVSYVLDEKDAYKDFVGKFDLDVIKLNDTENPVKVEDWINAIKSCKLLITDSFHGTCFAIIFNKPFICLTNKSRGIARFDTLRAITGIENNFISSFENIETLPECPNYPKVNASLNVEIKRCLERLENVIKNNYSNNLNKTEYTLKKTIQIRKYAELFLFSILRMIAKKHRVKIDEKLDVIKYSLDWGR